MVKFRFRWGFLYLEINNFIWVWYYVSFLVFIVRGVVFFRYFVYLLMTLTLLVFFDSIMVRMVL